MSLPTATRPPAPEDTPRAAMSLLDRRATMAIVAVLCILAGLAWWSTVGTARGMTDMVSGLAQVGARMPNDMAAGLFLTMWVAMMVAMMFPTVAPIVLAHRMVVRSRNEGPAPTISFVAGYLAVWAAIGIVPLAAFLAFRDLSADAVRDRWLSVLAGGVILLAGAYQFTQWKATCLRACRAPMSFLMTHDFRRGTPGAFAAGVSHGAYCLGCCWALMAVLVIVGLMNLVWMALIALVFFAEKNWRRGVGLTRVVGATLIVIGCAVLVYPDLLQTVSGV